MLQILLFLLFAIAGYGMGKITGINPVEIEYFDLFASIVLVIGLYGSVTGIDLTALRNRRRMVFIIITLAVPIQILVTGGIMWLIHPAGVSLLLAVAITQIDPLSVTTLLRDKEKMSQEAKSMLRVWASFDDPLTVLFGFLILLPLVTNKTSDVTLPLFLLGLVMNLVPAAIVLWVKRETQWLADVRVEIVVLIFLFVLAVYLEAYLLIAIIGLILRPLSEEYLSRLIFVLFHFIVFTVGMAIFTYGVDLRLAILLVVVEFFAVQPITTLIVFNGTPSDLLRISYSQQNGLTTLLMGIAFEAHGVHVLHILLPAIIIMNLTNLTINRIYTHKERLGLIHEPKPNV